MYPFSTHLQFSLLPSQLNLVTFSSEPFLYLSLEFSEPHKSSLIISLTGFPLEVVNAHLTSGLNDEALFARKRQIETLTNFISSKSHNDKQIIVVGDFNQTSH